MFLYLHQPLYFNMSRTRQSSLTLNFTELALEESNVSYSTLLALGTYELYTQNSRISTWSMTLRQRSISNL